MDAFKSGADALFILLGGIMILAMHAGFAFLELGTVRRKNQVNALVKILIEPKNALVKQYAKLFDMEDVELEFTDDALHAVAK